MSKEEKRKVGRPTKLTKELIDIFTDIVNANVLAYTEEDIFDELYDTLKEKGMDTICYRTFQYWKTDEQDSKYYKKFLHVIKKALRKQKKVILNALLNDPDDKQWQRKAWICERKFQEWNLKKVSENTNDVTVKGLPNFLLKGGDKSK